MSADENNPAVSAVNLDILSVQVHYANEAMGNSGWVALNANAGIYNILMYRDEIAADIAQGTQLLSGPINGVRVILGERNSVFVTGEKEYALSIPEKTLLAEIKMNALIAEGKTLFLSLHFDPASSVITESNGTFSLSRRLGLNLSL
jgi:hypothetical protein